MRLLGIFVCVGLCLLEHASLAQQPRAPGDEDRLWQYRNLGKAFYENPTTQAEAVEQFKQALALRPNSARELLNYGLALLRAGKTDEAIAVLKKVQQQDPKLPQTWFNLGIVYRKNGDTQAAIQQFEQMVKLVPDEPVSRYNLGVLYRQAGKTDAARDQLRMSEKLDPNLAAPHFQLYNLYRQAGERERASGELAEFQRIKKQQEGAAIPEDMESSDYAEIYDPIDAAPEPAPATQPKYRDVTLAAAGDAKRAGVALIDSDGGGHADLLVWAGGKLTLYRRGVEPVKDSGLESLTGVVAASPGDFDNDGLADLCVLTETRALLFHNVKGRFEPVPAKLPQRAFTKAVWLDFDHDYDLDLLLFGEEPALVRNQGAAGFADRSDLFPFVKGHPVDATTFRLIRDSKAHDLVVSDASAAGTIYRDELVGHYSAQSLAALDARARGLRAGDVNHDGWLDLAGTSGVLINRDGALQAPAGTGTPPEVAADFDGDGRIDVAMVMPDGSVVARMNRTEPKNRWITVQLNGIKNIKLAYEAEVEVRAGRWYTKKVYEGVPLTFDLHAHAVVDAVRITWPNGLIQNETQQAADKAYSYKEAQRLSGSCPMIWSWNGEKFEFVTDVLGVAPLGAMSGEGQYFPTDHREYIQIPGEALQNDHGLYRVQISEELSEVSYLDQVKLLAVDHPANEQVFTNEKWKSPPFPPFRLFGVTRRIDPVTARDDHGRDGRDELKRIDRAYPTGFPHNLIGVADLHTLTLDFGPGAAKDNRAVLVLNGWVDWADGSTFLAQSQEGKGGLTPPSLQVKDARGEWKTVIADMGMPSGKPKSMAVDLSGKFLSSSREVRIVTNMCVYWDEIFLSDGPSRPRVQLAEAPVEKAEVEFRGFSDSKIDPLRRQPETFFHDRTKPVSYWNPTPGMYTRYGDVTPLVREPDDMYVVMGSGDELRLTYRADALPPPPAGWRRDFILKVDGWAKDRDANTAHSQSVEPLPFHAMSHYPYPSSEHYPDDAEHREYRKTYNIRPALRLLRPLTEGLDERAAGMPAAGIGSR